MLCLFRLCGCASTLPAEPVQLSPRPPAAAPADEKATSAAPQEEVPAAQSVPPSEPFATLPPPATSFEKIVAESKEQEEAKTSPSHSGCPLCTAPHVGPMEDHGEEKSPPLPKAPPPTPESSLSDSGDDVVLTIDEPMAP